MNTKEALKNAFLKADRFTYQEKEKINFSKKGLTYINTNALKRYRNCKLLDLSNNYLQQLSFHSLHN